MNNSWQPPSLPQSFNANMSVLTLEELEDNLTIITFFIQLQKVLSIRLGSLEQRSILLFSPQALEIHHCYTWSIAVPHTILHPPFFCITFIQHLSVIHLQDSETKFQSIQLMLQNYKCKMNTISNVHLVIEVSTIVDGTFYNCWENVEDKM